MTDAHIAVKWYHIINWFSGDESSRCHVPRVCVFCWTGSSQCCDKHTKLRCESCLRIKRLETQSEHSVHVNLEGEDDLRPRFHVNNTNWETSVITEDSIDMTPKFGKSNESNQFSLQGSTRLVLLLLTLMGGMFTDGKCVQKAFRDHLHDQKCLIGNSNDEAF